MPEEDNEVVSKDVQVKVLQALAAFAKQKGKTLEEVAVVGQVVLVGMNKLPVASLQLHEQ